MTSPISALGASIDWSFRQSAAASSSPSPAAEVGRSLAPSPAKAAEPAQDASKAYGERPAYILEISKQALEAAQRDHEARMPTKAPSAIPADRLMAGKSAALVEQHEAFAFRAEASSPPAEADEAAASSESKRPAADREARSPQQAGPAASEDLLRAAAKIAARFQHQAPLGSR